VKEALAKLYKLSVPESLTQILSAADSLASSSKVLVDMAQKQPVPELKNQIKSVKDNLRLLFGLTNVCEPSQPNEQLQGTLKSEALKLNYSIKELVTLVNQVNFKK